MKSLKIAVVEHDAWNGFLIQRLVDSKEVLSAARLSMEVWDTAVSHFDAVLFQINVSDIKKFPLPSGLRIETMLQEKSLYVMNEHLHDITKSNMHNLLQSFGLPSLRAQQEGDPDEVLFLKSDMNYGGERDRDNLNLKSSVPLLIESSTSYFRKKRRDIEQKYWHDPQIVIEKYVVNQFQKFCRLYACGESMILVHAYSERLIKKINGHSSDRNVVFTWEDLHTRDLELPENLIHTISTFHEKSTFDYYCLDIVYDDDYNFYVIDINTTPYIGLKEEFDPDLFVFLRLGLERRIWEKQSKS